MRVAPKRPRRTSLDEPIRLLNGASASESNRSNKEHRERQGGLWGRGLGCGRTAHIWSYDPGPITRPQTHILRAFCRLTSPCLAHRRDGDSPAAASKHRPTSACCARRRPPRRLALPCSASITTPGHAPAAPARRTRAGGRTACVVCGPTTVWSLLYGPSSVVRYRIYRVCSSFQRGQSYHHRVHCATPPLQKVAWAL